MARIRSVHPDLHRDKTLANVSAAAERTFVRLWCHLDDDGRGEDDLDLLKADLYPRHNDMDHEAIDRDLDELAQQGLIIRYEIDGEWYLACKHSTWSKYQRPQKKRESDLPGPDDERATIRPLRDPYGSGPVVVPPVGEGRGEGDVGDREEDLAAMPPKSVVVDGFPEPVPVSGKHLAKNLTAWAETSGYERPADRRPLPQFRWLLSVVDEVLGSGTHSHGCRMALIGEWCELAGSKPPESEAWGHVARLVSSYGGLPTLEAMHEATTNGAGLDGEWRDDPRALTKYATRVLKNREAA